MVCKHCNEPLRSVTLGNSATDWIHADGRADHVPDPKPDTEYVIFTMRVELPIDTERTAVHRLVHSAAEVIMHVGENAVVSEQRKVYIRDHINPDVVIGEWAIGPDPDPTGTATYAFSEREIAMMLHALRIVQEIRASGNADPQTHKGCYHEEVNTMTLGSIENSCDHFNAAPLDDEEIDALCDRMNPLDAVVRQ